MRFLHDHQRITCGRRAPQDNLDGTTRMATPIRLDGRHVGFVARAQRPCDGWVYRLIDSDGKPWNGSYDTRADAADHLVSAWSPSASWLT